MRKNINGWTMAELVVSMLVLAIIMILSIQAVKPKKIKTVPFAYAAINNLNNAARYVLSDKNATNLSDATVSYPVADSNESCVLIAEAMSLLDDYTCVKTANCKPAQGEGDTGTPNFRTANLIAYSGLEKDFYSTFRGAASESATCAETSVGMKDIMIDVDGDDGDNTIGKDQFPIKLLQTGEVIPGTCSDIVPVAMPAGCDGQTFNNPTFSKHPDCGTDTKVYINEKEPFAYTVYKSRLVTEAEINSGKYKENERISEVLIVDDSVKSQISFAEADCISRSNILTRGQCESLGYEPSDECTAQDVYCYVKQSKPVTMTLFTLPY